MVEIERAIRSQMLSGMNNVTRRIRKHGPKRFKSLEKIVMTCPTNWTKLCETHDVLSNTNHGCRMLKVWSDETRK